jgi:hypothetical protein
MVSPGQALARKAEQSSRRAEGRAYYPQALVGLTVMVDDLQPLPAAYPRYYGALKRLQNTVLVAAKPTAVRICRNSYQAPDSFSVEFDARVLPLSPKQVRTCAVEIYLWSAPYLGAPVPQDASGNILLEPVIVGLVDDVTARYEGEGHVVTVDGQDYTALFSEREWPRRRAPAGKRLDIQLEELIREGPGGVMRLRVEPETLRGSLPVVGAAAARTNKKGKPVKEKSSWWDVMYRMAQQEGFILFVEGFDVVLAEPRTLHQHRAGILPGSQPRRPVYRFAWGRNLSRLEIQRHLGKERTPVIEVRSYDPATRKTLSARYPERGEKATVGIGTEREQIHVCPLHGVRTLASLRRAARTRYELIAKGEQTLSWSTDDCTDAVGADVLQLCSGDAASLDFDLFNREEILRLTPATRARRLEQAGFPADVARYVADNFDVVDQLKGPFRVKEVTIDYSAANGLTIDVEAQEYVKVPED